MINECTGDALNIAYDSDEKYIAAGTIKYNLFI